MLANHVYAHLLLLLQPSVLWLSIVTFNNYVKPPGAKVNFARIWCITNPTPTSLGYLTLKRWHGKIWPQLRGLPGVADRATHLEGWPHLSCKRDQIKMRDYMDRRVTPSKWVTSPTWGPLPPCKQALKVIESYPSPFSIVSAVKSFTIYHLSQSCTTWVSLLRLDKLFFGHECFSAKYRGFMINCAVFWSLS